METPWESAIVPAAAPTSSVAFVRSLGREGVRTIVATDSSTAPAARSRYCDEAVPVPSPKSDMEGYRQALLALAMRPDVRTIVPLRGEDVYVLSKYRDEFADHIATFYPTFETLRTVHDRVRFYDAARKAGVPIPDTRPADEVESWTGEQVVKPRFGILTEDYVADPTADGSEMSRIHFLQPGEQPDIDALTEAFQHTPLVQEYLRGKEYSCGVLFDDGDPVVTSQKAVLRGNRYHSGPSVYHECVDIPELETVTRRLLEHLDWHGPADVDFVQDHRTGEFKVLEINPRFWTTVNLEIHAGFDFPVSYWRLCTGQNPIENPAGAVGTKSHFLRGEAVYLGSILLDAMQRAEHPLYERPALTTASAEIVRSVIADPTTDLWSLRDPAPFLYDIRNAAGLAVSHIREELLS